MCGQPINIQVSQSFNDGHPNMEWHRGIAMTAKEEGLWDTAGMVTKEEIRHMKARVEVFHATHKVGDNPDEFDTSPNCAESWCRWVLVDSIAYAAREGPRAIKGTIRRKPLPLPSLGSESVASAPSGERRLSDEQKERIAANRLAAQKRKVFVGESATNPPRGERTLSNEEKKRISDNRRAAQSQKAKRKRGAERPVQFDDWEEEEEEEEDDVFGHAMLGMGCDE